MGGPGGVKSSITGEDYKYVFEELLDMSDDGFLFVDRNGTILNINESYANFLGQPKSKIIGSYVKDIIANTEMMDIMAQNRRDINFVSVILNELELSPNSKEKVSSITRSPVKNNSGEIIGSVAQVKFRKQTLFNAKELDEFYKILSDYDMDLLNKLKSEKQIAEESDEVKRLQLQLEYYKKELKKNKQNKLDYVIGTSPNFLEAKTKALKAAKNSFSVLITGETGTGKEVIADLIHWVSDRSEHPFIKINCAAIPPELFESELFGYEKGAFTGAVKEGKKGKFELAHKGTILLDEIGDLPLNMQTKLLRVLQDGIIEPIGAVKPVPVDVRIIAATNANLEEMIQKKQFRQDLYYRLNEIRIILPRLAERKSDIIPIAQHVLNKLNWEFETEVCFSPEVLEYLLNYDWPGNIRELNNVVKSAYFLVEGNTIEVSHLPDNIVLAQPDTVSIDNTLEEYLSLCEKKFIIRTLKKNKGNRTKTAKSLGIHRSNLYKKLEKYNININEY